MSGGEQQLLAIGRVLVTNPEIILFDEPSEALSPVVVEKLADVVYMSCTTFYTNFREVMQVSPLQYAKSVKLHETQRLIKEGKQVIEASFLVGYHNLTQFSREYKRHFGYAPSAMYVLFSLSFQSEYKRIKSW